MTDKLETGGPAKMDNKMRTTYEAWWEKQRNDASTPTDHDIIEWTLDYLRSQQEPVAWRVELKAGQYTYVDKPEHAGKYGRVSPLYAHPIPSAPAVPEGWKLVPIEPTSAMKTAGCGVEVYQDSPAELDALTWEESAAIWRAMLAAAPTKENSHD